MSHQHQATVAVIPWPVSDASIPLSTCKRGDAYTRLLAAYQDGTPASILVGDTHGCTRTLVDSFLADVDDVPSVVRLTGPFPDATALMGDIIRGIGFESTDLTLADLDNVFSMFLGFQKTHRARTIICIEKAHDHGAWLYDQLGKLAQLDADNHYGLMTIVAGRPDLNEQLHGSTQLGSLIGPEHRIAIAPLTLAETRDYVMSRVESLGTCDIAGMFEYDAITRIHELTQGVQDHVGKLYDECLELGTQQRQMPITSHMVDAVYGNIPNADEDIHVETSPSLPMRRLFVRVNDKITKKVDLDRGHVLIGRDRFANIRMISPSVSRHHALLVNVSDGIAIIDLASTNGTHVNGTAIKQCDLKHLGEIAIGDYTMQYSTDAEQLDWYLDIVQPDSVPIHNVACQTQTLQPKIKGNINRKGEKIYHVIGSASYNSTHIDESKGERWFNSEEEALAAGWRAARR